MPTIDTSGAGALIIDADVARAWTGFHVRAKATDDNVDLETDDGAGWRIHDRFDFEHPVTAYDRLCRRHQRSQAPVLIGRLRGQSYVSIGDGCDTLGWWPALGVFTGNTGKQPARREVARAVFTRLGTVDMPSGRVWLMNPCDHGAAVKAGRDAILIRMKAGRYIVDFRPVWAGGNTLLVRLTKVGRGA